MLKGITILNSYDVTSPEWREMLAPSVGFSILVLFGLIIITWIIYDKTLRKAAVILLYIIIGLTLLFFMPCVYGFTHLPENKYQTRYEVTISDEVNFNEFNSKYEIVTQKGLIYTIVEKTD